MLIHYTVVAQTLTIDDIEHGTSGEYSVLENDAADLRYIIRRARSLGIESRQGDYFVSIQPDEDRGYFERGESRYYTLSFPGQSAMRLSRLSRLLGATGRR